jgi:hypothetical protein
MGNNSLAPSCKDFDNFLIPAGKNYRTSRGLQNGNILTVQEAFDFRRNK